MSDMIYRADAIEVVHKHFIDALDDFPTITDEDGYVIIKDTKSVNELLKHNKAISKALEALPSVEAKGDLISRQWLLDLYETPKHGEGINWKVPLEVVQQNIKDAPSADAALQLNRIDTLIIANALRYLINDEEQHELNRATAELLRERILKYGASMCKDDEDK